MDLPTEPRLISAINTLSALQCLAMGYNGNHQQPELFILAQLKMAVIFFGTTTKGVFQRSLERHAAGNVDLKLVHLNMSFYWLRGEEGNQFEEPTPPLRPLAQLTSLKALDLYLHLHFHKQMQWLKHLPETMP
ncbi:hypothetical protein TYRP_016899 [Tyrophagus putrescentiae]|nr:hypothetical protein TYRP_016899 [Tyrophagus putrescentiae]